MRNLVVFLAMAVLLVWTGDLIIRTRVVRAQSYGPIYVDVVHGTGGDVKPRGGKVVGFSCVASSGGNSCYVASQ